MYTGPNFLIPLAFEVSWTGLREAFNDYPQNFDSDGNLTPVGVEAANTPPADGSEAQYVPIPYNVPAQTALVAANPNRTFLLIQNNSTAGSGGTAPNLLVSYDGPVQTANPQLNLTIYPGAGIVLDRRVPTNAIYVAWVGAAPPFTGGGVLHQGLLPVQ